MYLAPGWWESWRIAEGWEWDSSKSRSSGRVPDPWYSGTGNVHSPALAGCSEWGLPPDRDSVCHLAASCLEVIPFDDWRTKLDIINLKISTVIQYKKRRDNWFIVSYSNSRFIYVIIKRLIDWFESIFIYSHCNEIMYMKRINNLYSER